MGEIAAGLTHEINQPLSAITNYTEGCIQRIEQNNADPNDIRKALEIVTDQADRAGQIINRIRGFIKKKETKKEKLHIDEIIDEALDLIKTDVDRRDITFNVENDAAELIVDVDKIQIQQVMMNLIRNGGDAMNEHGSKNRVLTIKTTTTEDGDVEFSVTDTGPGIPKEKISQIFDPFFTTKSSGLGLGLNICQSIVESHGGRMWATSPKGKGATIHFTLPQSSKGITHKEKKRAA